MQVKHDFEIKGRGTVGVGWSKNKKDVFLPKLWQKVRPVHCGFFLVLQKLW